MLSSLSKVLEESLAKSNTSLSTFKVNNVEHASGADLATNANHLTLANGESGSITNNSPTSYISLPMNKMFNHPTYIWLHCHFNSGGSQYWRCYLLGMFYFNQAISDATKASNGIVSYTFDTNSNYNVTFVTNNNQMLSMTLGYGIAQNLDKYIIYYYIF